MPRLVTTFGLSSVTRRAVEHGGLLESDTFQRRDLWHAADMRAIFRQSFLSTNAAFAIKQVIAA